MMLSQTTRYVVPRLVLRTASQTNRSFTQLRSPSSSFEGHGIFHTYRANPIVKTTTPVRDPLVKTDVTGIQLLDPYHRSPAEAPPTTSDPLARWANVDDFAPSPSGVPESYQMLNRNARKPKKANHGKRPCSRYGRRKRARQYGNPKRGW